MKRNNNGRKLVTKKLLQSSLIELMQERPFEQISIKDICQRADLNRTTFYLHYPNQAALLDEIKQNAYNNIEEYISNIKLQNDKIKQLSILLDYIHNNISLFRILLFHHGGDFQKSFILRILDVVNENKMINASPGKEQYTKSFIINGCYGFIVSWIEDDFRMPSTELAILLYNLCRNAHEGSKLS